MTRPELLTNIDTMTIDLKTDILNECKRLINSGTMDLDPKENSFIPARIILSAALENISTGINWNKSKFTAKNKKDYRNLLRS